MIVIFVLTILSLDLDFFDLLLYVLFSVASLEFLFLFMFQLLTNFLGWTWGQAFFRIIVVYYPLTLVAYIGLFALQNIFVTFLVLGQLAGSFIQFDIRTWTNSCRCLFVLIQKHIWILMSQLFIGSVSIFKISIAGYLSKYILIICTLYDFVVVLILEIFLSLQLPAFFI